MARSASQLLAQVSLLVPRLRRWARGNRGRLGGRRWGWGWGGGGWTGLGGGPGPSGGGGHRPSGGGSARGQPPEPGAAVLADGELRGGVRRAGGRRGSPGHGLRRGSNPGRRRRVACLSLLFLADARPAPASRARPFCFAGALAVFVFLPSLSLSLSLLPSVLALGLSCGHPRPFPRGRPQVLVVRSELVS